MFEGRMGISKVQEEPLTTNRQGLLLGPLSTSLSPSKIIPTRHGKQEGKRGMIPREPGQGMSCEATSGDHGGATRMKMTVN